MKIQQAAAIAIISALTLACVRAQTVDLRATIPFDFSAGDASMPAGEYEIHEKGAVVLMQRVAADKTANAEFETFAAASSDPNGSARLSFHRFGEQYFLATIWNGGSGGGRAVHPTDREKEMVTRLGTSIEATVPARKR